MSRDSEWKRPVVIPGGLTVAQAKKKYDDLAANANRVEEEGLKVMEERMRSRAPMFGPGGRQLGLTDEQRNFRKLQREVMIAKRILEELQSSQSK